MATSSSASRCLDRTKAKQLLDSLKTDDKLGEAVSQYCDIIERGDTMTAYEFQFRWIPSMLFEWEKGNVDDTQLTDITAWKLNLGSMFISQYEWDWSAISAQVYSQPNNIDIIVYRMPEPENLPLCRYVAAFVPIDNCYKCLHYLCDARREIEAAGTIQTQSGATGTDTVRNPPIAHTC